jgi:hypothetical protein
MSSGCNDLDLTVLVGVIYVMQQPQRTRLTSFPSVIRLQPLDCCPVFRFQIGKGILPPPLIRLRPNLATGAIQVDREAWNCWVNGGILENGKLKHHMVEDRPQVMSDFSHNYGPSIRKGRGISFYTEIPSTNARIEIGYDNSIGICLKETDKFSVQALDVLVCPSNLSDCTTESLHGLYYQYE